MLFGKKLMVLVDAQDLRRVAFTNLFTSLLSGKNVLLLDCSSVSSLTCSQPFGSAFETMAPLVILNAGGLGLDNSHIAKDIARLRAVMPRCLVLVMIDGEWNGNIEIALALAINGVICMSMQPQNVIAAIEIALMGGTYFPSISQRDPEPRESKTRSQDHLAMILEPAIIGFGQLTEEDVLPSTIQAVEHQTDSETNTVSAQIAPLSRRQVDVLKTLQSGMSNKEIARALGLSEATIKIHVRHLMRKFGVHNRTQVAIVSQHGGLHGQKKNVTVRQAPYQ